MLRVFVNVHCVSPSATGTATVRVIFECAATIRDRQRPVVLRATGRNNAESGFPWRYIVGRGDDLVAQLAGIKVNGIAVRICQHIRERLPLRSTDNIIRETHRASSARVRKRTDPLASGISVRYFDNTVGRVVRTY